ncbi:MAG: YgfZ/GcvT domain-containing protein [Solirubrobacteraceae bacterium]
MEEAWSYPLQAVSSLDTTGSEYAAITEGCALVDRSERGKLALVGPDAKSFLQGQVSNDVEALTPGRGCYAAFLTPKGKMLGDLRILDTEHELLLDTERVALQELFNMIRRFSVGYDVELQKLTVQRGLLSLLGPSADQVAGVQGLTATEHTHTATDVAGIPARAVRTDMGIDLFCDAGDTDSLAQALERAGADPVSDAVADCVRVERGRPRYGIDLDDTVIPQEAGLNARAVSFTKGCYVGQETVARLYYRGKPNRQLRGLRLSGAAASGAEITLGGRVVGRLGSVAASPTLGRIGLALVRREAPPGSDVTVGPDELEAVVVELPFER